MKPRLALAVMLAALAGCAGEPQGYPSLAPRAAEKQGFGEPVAPPVAIAADPALDGEIARQGAELDRIGAGFAAAAGKAEAATRLAAHQPVGSDAWLAAQAALATLDDWRARSTALTADVEALGSARAARLAPPYPALDALVARAAAEADREAESTRQLQASVPVA